MHHWVATIMGPDDSVYKVRRSETPLSLMQRSFRPCFDNKNEIVTIG
jgi:hypothetical protein